MSNFLPTLYQEFIYKSRYAKFLDKEGRRENWSETVARYFDFMTGHLQKNHNYELTANDRKELEDAVLALEIMPSMRALMTAGPSLERDNTCAYNCSYVAVDDVKAFDEAMLILMNGTGVGFSVERQYVQQLPEIPANMFECDTTIIVKDSKEGWAKAFRQLLALLYSGEVPKWDVSLLRPAGARLKTFGGRSSGPGPLEDLFKFAVKMFRGAAGRKLNSLEAHDLMCKIGEVVVVGGVRRSAMISLSNLTDERMRNAKNGSWWETNPHRALSNNSAAYTEKPEMGTFMREWLSLYDSKSGERGIFSRVASQNQAKKFGRRDPNHDFGTNPCSEIILRPNQFCNLTEVVIRGTDGVKDIERKVRLAARLGTIQSTLTKFPYLRKIWSSNTEEERLLGVGLTGIMDNTITNGRSGHDTLAKVLESLRDAAVETNKQLAAEIGIPQSAAVTCVKPSGTVSQLVDSASGIHARHNNYYIRTVRGDNKDPLTMLLKESGFPWEKCVMKPESTTVFSFPVKAPEGCVTRTEMTAVEQLEMWLLYQRHWCEHKPSVTITVKEEEWMDVGAFVYEYFDEMSGVSFLPHSDHTYRQAPYQDCNEREYSELEAIMPKVIDWQKLADYESEDNTKGSQTLACAADGCEIVDL
ncbi:RTPR, ribonucleoside-triphosphate reductase, adenosylcobalamin-dependent [uncultured Caudovirales phage]|uniref:RTPR, ribonucleoside-triphosphate reductase, adenosylcobalamin-dependent n=1 Tax=uncultured Caudovirales phage TaxID=2100421 RepID=A0A6J7WTZ1_9CAUD|nr:RTPR, ribonucleoside-triphosphate reductase, adenosylcobalamin-dependent [uncultured Caudovirales phage]